MSIHQSLIFSRNLLKFHSQTRFSFPRHSKPHNFFSLFISMKKLFHYAHLSILYHHAFYLIQHKFLSNKKKQLEVKEKKKIFRDFLLLLLLLNIVSFRFLFFSIQKFSNCKQQKKYITQSQCLCSSCTSIIGKAYFCLNKFLAEN